MANVIRLKRDIVIPAGTELHACPHTRTYSAGNMEGLLGLSKDVTASFVFFPDDLTDKQRAELIEEGE